MERSGMRGYPSDERDEQLARAEARGGFYEPFDRLIQENIRRSGELMQEAIALRDRARGEQERAEQARDTLNHRMAAQRARHRAMLAAVLDELNAVRDLADRLSTRVSDALDDLEPQPEPDEEPLPSYRQWTTDPPAMVRPAPRSVPDSEPVAEPPLTPPPPAASLRTMSVEAGAAPMAPPAAPEGARVFTAPPARAEPERAATRPVDLLVHGVPRASTALSLQRYLAGLGHVHAVEAREFAEGLLRLQVSVTQPLTADALDGWPDGFGLESIREQPHLLEVKLPGANGF